MDDTSFKNETAELLKALSDHDLRNVGLHQVAYIKTRDRFSNGRTHYSVHAADGSQISIMDSYDTALETIRVNDLFPVTVH